MLSPSPYRVGEPNCFYFWNLPVHKKFSLPTYYIGQVVLHIIKRPDGEILHPVEVFGVMWNGTSWEYAVSLLEGHPMLETENWEWEWISDWQLEPI